MTAVVVGSLTATQLAARAGLRTADLAAMIVDADRQPPTVPAGPNRQQRRAMQRKAARK